jgi:hypothetical protein
MEKSIEKIEELAKNSSLYFKHHVSLIKLEAAEKTSKIMSNGISLIFISMIFFLFAFFFGLAFAVMLQYFVGELYLALLIVAGFYGIIGIILWKFRNKLIRIPIMNSILHELFKDSD